MIEILNLSHKDFKAALLKMHRQTAQAHLIPFFFFNQKCQQKNLKVSAKNITCKEEPNENLRKV